MSGTIPAKGFDRPDLRLLFEHVLKDVSSNWYDLGQKLLEQNDEVDVIKVNYANDETECCKKMFQLWLHRCLNPTWNQLIQALKEVELTNLAAKIEGMLIPTEDTVGATAGDDTTTNTDGITINKFKSENERYKRPTLSDMYKCVVLEYAHNWRYLGTLLGFKNGEMEFIFNDFHSDSEECCRLLLLRWLNKNRDASWDQLFSAIDDLPQPSLQDEPQDGHLTPQKIKELEKELSNVRLDLAQKEKDIKISQLQNQELKEEIKKLEKDLSNVRLELDQKEEDVKISHGQNQALIEVN